MRTFIPLLFASGLFAQRLPQLKLEETTPEQRPVAERMLKETRVGLGGPWSIMLRSPTPAKAMIDLYHYFRWDSGLPARIVELTILIAAKESQAPYEWFVHYPIALKDGVGVETAAAIKAGKRPVRAKADELAAYDFASELLRSRRVSDKAYQAAKSVFGEKGVVDLTVLAGTYQVIGGLLNVGETWGEVGSGPEYLPVPGR